MGQDESKSAGEGATVRGNELGARVLVGGERVSFLASRSVRCTCGGLRMLAANQCDHLVHFWRHLGRYSTTQLVAKV